MDYSKLSPAQLLAALKNGGGYSGFDGKAAAFGYGDPRVNYLGDKNGSLVSSQTQSFGLKVVNAHSSEARSFYLSRGSDSGRRGALVSGAFNAIEENSGTSLTASATISGQTIAKLNTFCYDQTAGVFVPEISVTATDATGFLATFIVFQDDSNPLLTFPARSVQVKDYTETKQNDHLEFLTIKDEIYISKYNTVIISVPANSTLTLNLKLAAALDPHQEFRAIINGAAADVLNNPALAQTVARAQNQVRLAEKIGGASAAV